jgi:hypothetical protein
MLRARCLLISKRRWWRLELRIKESDSGAIAGVLALTLGIWE